VSSDLLMAVFGEKLSPQSYVKKLVPLAGGPGSGRHKETDEEKEKKEKGREIEKKAADWSKKWAANSGRGGPGHSSEDIQFKSDLMGHLEDRAKEEGWNYGWKQDPEAKGRFTYVEYFDTPAGQISFHAASPKLADTTGEIENLKSQLPDVIKAYKEKSNLSFSGEDEVKGLPETGKIERPKGFTSGTAERNFDNAQSILDQKTITYSELGRPSSKMKTLLDDRSPAHADDPRAVAIKEKAVSIQAELSKAHSLPEYQKIQDIQSKLQDAREHRPPEKIYNGEWDGKKGVQAERLEKLFETDGGRGSKPSPASAKSRPMGGRSLALANTNIGLNYGE